MFAAGAALPVTVLLIGLPWLGSRGVFVGLPPWMPLGLLAAAACAGGAVAGRGLDRGRRGPVALAVAYGAGLWPVWAVVGTLSALTGRDPVGEVAARFVPAFAVSALLVGVLAAAGLDRRWRRLPAVAAVGAAVGAVGGLWLTIVVALVSPSVPTVEFAVAVVGGGGGGLVSAALGGWMLRRRGQGVRTHWRSRRRSAR